jgi:RimJ/RimL family protein N-acetyltransferase
MGTTIPEPLRQSRLPDGRELVVREASDDDLAGLRALYDGLDDDARYRRFFSLYRPGDRFYQRLLTAADRGGACLVVVVNGPDQEPEVVAEAGYEPLPNGDAELAITIDRHWRGWLGPYLLDALLEHASAHGFPNLEADVLVTNRPMLALLRNRRCGTLPRTEWTVQRAVVGADHAVPSWPPRRTGRRILVEGGSGRGPADDEAMTADLDVIACPGPDGCRPRCPLLNGERCPLVDGADAIAMASSTTGEMWDEIRAAHRRQNPEVPVVVESPRARRGGPDLIELVQERLADQA